MQNGLFCCLGLGGFCFVCIALPYLLAIFYLNKEIIHPLRNASKGDGVFLELLRYCLVHMESYAMERYRRKRGVSRTVNFTFGNGFMTLSARVVMPYRRHSFSLFLQDIL